MTYCNLSVGGLTPEDDYRFSFAADEVNCWRCICVYTGKEMTFSMPDSPQHDLVRESHDLPQKLCEFVEEFLRPKGIFLAEEHQHSKFCHDDDDPKAIRLCQMRQRELIPAQVSVVKLAAEFIGLDVPAYDREKDEALTYQRKLNELVDWAATEGKALMLEMAKAGPTPLRRCNKQVKVTYPPTRMITSVKCDDEPGHGGKCWSKLYRPT